MQLCVDPHKNRHHGYTSAKESRPAAPHVKFIFTNIHKYTQIETHTYMLFTRSRSKPVHADTPTKFTELNWILVWP